MAALLLLRGIPFIRVRLGRQRLATGTFSLLQHPWSSTADPTRLDDEVSNAEKTTAVFSARDPRKYPRWDNPDYRMWKDKEEDFIRDIEAIVSLTKEILHSHRSMIIHFHLVNSLAPWYLDGERLTAEDEKAVVEKLLTYYPNSEDKIGCGLDSIMVDRHPQFKYSRCLFVVRTDGGWIDFSYQKSLRAYIRYKYPEHAERFIREHFKRGS